MKNFFTSLLGSLFALLIFTFGSILVVALFIGAVAAMKQRTVGVEKGAWLVFDLSAVIKDAPEDSSVGSLFSDLAGGNHGPSTLQLRQVTRSIKAAAIDDKISGLFLTGNVIADGSGSGFAALQEVRDAIGVFKAAKKPVKAYINFADTKDYFLLSAATEVVLDPYGAIYMPGLATEPMFFAGAFEKYGVGVQVTRVGKYKSFVEPFTRKDMSRENREQTQKLLDDLWGNLVGDIEKTRGLKEGTIQTAVDAEGLLNPTAAIKYKFVDRVAYFDEVLDDLKKKTGRNGPKDVFKQVSLPDYIASLRDSRSRRSDTSSGSQGPIAIVYAEGDIVDGEGDVGEIGGDRYAREIRRLRQDDNVKAILLRVNSPGGSATASEEIQREIRLAMKAKKLVVVSMGSYAASGGYWISAYADRVFAEPTTVTGSIGVFGLFLNFQGLANNVGVTFDSVKTGKYAGALTVSRPKTDEELAVLQREIDWIYGEFIHKVAEGRKLDENLVQDIAQGRVWSGSEALQLGLVDEIGGLADALHFVQAKIGAGDRVRISEFPQKRTLTESIAELLDNHGQDFTQSRSKAFGGLLSRVTSELRSFAIYNDPKGIYARVPFNLTIK